MRSKGEGLLPTPHRFPTHLSEVSHVEQALDGDAARAAVLRAELKACPTFGRIIFRGRLSLLHELLTLVREGQQVGGIGWSRCGRAVIPEGPCSSTLATCGDSGETNDPHRTPFPRPLPRAAMSHSTSSAVPQVIDCGSWTRADADFSGSQSCGAVAVGNPQSIAHSTDFSTQQKNVPSVIYCD